jgi:hypothetical protein
MRSPGNGIGRLLRLLERSQSSKWFYCVDCQAETRSLIQGPPCFAEPGGRTAMAGAKAKRESVYRKSLSARQRLCKKTLHLGICGRLKCALIQCASLHAQSADRIDRCGARAACPLGAKAGSPPPELFIPRKTPAHPGQSNGIQPARGLKTSARRCGGTQTRGTYRSGSELTPRIDWAPVFSSATFKHGERRNR